MDQKLVIIILAGFIVGMMLTVPTIFLADVFVAGLVVAALSGGIGHAVMYKNKTEKRT